MKIEYKEQDFPHYVTRLAEVFCKVGYNQTTVRISLSTGQSISMKVMSEKGLGYAPHFLEALNDAAPGIKEFIESIPFSAHSRLHSRLISELQRRQDMRVQEEATFSPEQIKFLQTHTPYLDIQTGYPILWSQNLRRSSDFDFRVLDSKFKGKQRAKLEAEMLEARLVFDPLNGHKSVTLEELEGRKIHRLNVYHPPVWHTEEYSNLNTLNPQLPPLFLAFVMHLFPVEVEREIVLDWISLALFSRPESMLSMRGVRGSGKTIFKYLLFHLIGHPYEATRQGLATFNADLKHKRIVGMDDHPTILSREGAAQRKVLTNSVMTYEAKGIQTSKSDVQWARVTLRPVDVCICICLIDYVQ